MKITHASFNGLFNNNIVKVEDFYSVGFTRRIITLQGNFSPEFVARINGWSLISDTEVITRVEPNGYISITFEYLDITVVITLT